jgi:hypothetical protein
MRMKNSGNIKEFAVIQNGIVGAKQKGRRTDSMIDRTKEKLTVGQELFKLNIGNMARNVAQKLTPVVVTKIGRKYFSVKSHGYIYETDFLLEDWTEKTEFTANACLYKNEQEWSDEKESAMICKAIWKAFEYGQNRNNVDLPKLRMIMAAIEGRTV